MRRTRMTQPTDAGSPAHHDQPDSTDGTHRPTASPTVHLILADREVTFNATLAGTLPPYDYGPHGWLDVYLTDLNNVAIHDPRTHSLAVTPLPEFITAFADSPVHYIVDDVLAKVHRTSEYLAI
jgi:hypothetical protein